MYEIIPVTIDIFFPYDDGKPIAYINEEFFDCIEEGELLYRILGKLANMDQPLEVSINYWARDDTSKNFEYEDEPNFYTWPHQLNDVPEETRDMYVNIASKYMQWQ